MELPTDKSRRIEVVDALRGFAVMAIILVHNIEHFIFPVYPTDQPRWLNALDQGVFDTVFSLFAGKAYAIFALLFGFTFYLQMSSSRRQGRDFGYRFLWRMLLLVCFATINAAFFPAGDVLLLFAVVSPVLFLMRHRSDKSLIAVAIILLLQPVEWCHYIASLLDPSHRLPDLRVSEMYAEVAAYTRAGDFRDFIVGNVTLGQKASLLWAVNAGRLCQTAGLFLLGFYIGRKGLFATSGRNARIWMKVLIISAISFAPLLALSELAMSGDTVTRQTAGTALDMWQKLTFTLVLVSSFVISYQGKAFRRAVGSLRYYGRMSLTNYITQSIIGAAIYFPFGLYLAPHCGYTVSLLIGLCTFVLQLTFCKWWLGRHRQGPLEYVWHRWTWLGRAR